MIKNIGLCVVVTAALLLGLTACDNGFDTQDDPPDVRSIQGMVERTIEAAPALVEAVRTDLQAADGSAGGARAVARASASDGSQPQGVTSIMSGIISTPPSGGGGGGVLVSGGGGNSSVLTSGGGGSSGVLTSGGGGSSGVLTSGGGGGQSGYNGLGYNTGWPSGLLAQYGAGGCPQQSGSRFYHVDVAGMGVAVVWQGRAASSSLGSYFRGKGWDGFDSVSVSGLGGGAGSSVGAWVSVKGLNAAWYYDGGSMGWSVLVVVDLSKFS